MVVEIKKSILAQQVEEGWKRAALAEYYGLPEAQMAQVLRDAGLKIRKFHAPKYQLVDDTIEEVDNEVVGEDVNTLTESVLEEEVTEETSTTQQGW